MFQKGMPTLKATVRSRSRRQGRRRMKCCTAAGAGASSSATTRGRSKTKTKTACSFHVVNVNVLAQVIFLSTTIILTISNLSSQIIITAHAEPSHSSNTIPRSNNRYTNYNNHGQTSSSSLSSTSTTSTTTSSSSLSDLSSPKNPDSTYTPPWNPSPKIDSHGFLSDIYSRTPGEWEVIANIRGKHGPRNKTKYTKLLSVPVRIRQVPGDGNCLFHSIASCLHYVTTSSTSSTSVDDDDRCHGHLPMDSFECFNQLRRKSLALRNSAVDVLANESSGGRRKLFLQGEEYLEARELLNAAAAQFDLEGEEYCELMRKESYWGGGPEIVALCNYLQRPIHIYELISAEEASNSQSTDTPPFNNNNDSPSSANNNNPKMSKQFTLRRMACFGSPKFDRREPLHILSADSRFPDIEPRRIRKVGNHFLALFPVTANDVALKGDKNGGFSDLVGNKFRRHALIRGGSRVQEGSKSGNKGGSGGSREASTNGSGNKRRGKDYLGNDNEVSERVLGRWDGGMGRWRTRNIVDWFV